MNQLILSSINLIKLYSLEILFLSPIFGIIGIFIMKKLKLVHMATLLCQILILTFISWCFYKYPSSYVIGEYKIYHYFSIPWFRLFLDTNRVININFEFGLNIYSFLFIFISVIIFVLSYISLLNNKPYDKKYHVLCLLLNSFIILFLSSLDFFVSYCFFEAILIPLYFLIRYGEKSSETAATKFFIYTIIGTISILIGLIYIINNTQITSLSFNTLINNIHLMSSYDQAISFLFILSGIFIKSAIVPFHNWLPSAHVKSSTPVSIILAGIVLKLGTYLLFILTFIFPIQITKFQDYIMYMCLFSSCYASLNAIGNKDLKSKIAYSSIVHMGYIIIGFITKIQNGTIGAMYQIISHALITSGLFYMAGMLYNRLNYSGIYKTHKYYSIGLIILCLFEIAIPLSPNLISEIFIIGSIKNIICINMFLFVMIINAICFINIIRSITSNEIVQQNNKIDLLRLPQKRYINYVNFVIILMIISISIFFGVYPRALFYTLT